MSGVEQVTVAESDDGQRLDRWLKKRMPFVVAQKMIRTGQVRVDGKRAKADTRLSAGQTVRIPPLLDKPDDYKRPTHRAHVDDPSYIKAMIIYDDGDIVALNKPGDIASQGGGGVERHIDALLEHLTDKKGRRPHLVHRLDRDTSGVLLCARAPESLRRLGKMFHDRRARKTYWAIVAPAPDQAEGTINAPVYKAKGPHKDRMMIGEDEDSKNAITDFKVVEFAAKKAAFIVFSPRTGRTHQLRVHAADVLNCPIVGDGKYGGAEARIGGEGIAKRLHLHARRLTLPHPSKDETIDITAPLPPDLAASWKALGFDESTGDSHGSFS